MRLSQPSWTRGLPTSLVVGAATLGPIGRRLPAPGTWGSLAGAGYFWVFFERLGVTGNVIASALGAYGAIALCGEAELRLGKQDPGEVILDEFVVMPLVFLGWRAGYLASWPPWAVLGAGFGFFRLYDIAKPFGIARLQRWPGGWGIVVDDLAAALVACGTLHLAGWLWTWR